MKTKRIIKSAFLCFLFIFQICVYSNAEIIQLKNGRNIEGNIAKETKDNVVISVGPGMDVTIAKIDIKSIDEGGKNISSADNAAKYYLKAITLLKYPEAKEINTRLEKILKTDWQKEDKELVQILKENEACLEEIKKASVVEICDFDMGKKYKYELEKKLPPVKKLKNLNQLLLLKGKYYEQQGSFNQAIDTYILSLTLAYHISQDNTLIAKIIALAIEKDTFALLKSCINLKKPDKKELKNILDYLNTYKQRHFPARELVEVEKKFFISTIQMLADGIKQKAEENPKLDDRAKIKAREFADEFVRQGSELVDRYYGNFAKAAETYNKGDWEFALKEVENLKKAAEPNLIENAKDISHLLFNAFIGNTEEYNREYSKKILIILIATGLPDFKKSVDNYYISLQELGTLIALVST